MDAMTSIKADMAATVEMAFADLLDVLRTMFQIPISGRKAPTLRLKHLQAKAVPLDLNVGRGGRARYLQLPPAEFAS